MKPRNRPPECLSRVHSRSRRLPASPVSSSSYMPVCMPNSLALNRRSRTVPAWFDGSDIAAVGPWLESLVLTLSTTVPSGERSRRPFHDSTSGAVARVNSMAAGLEALPCTTVTSSSRDTPGKLARVTILLMPHDEAASGNVRVTVGKLTKGRTGLVRPSRADQDHGGEQQGGGGHTRPHQADDRMARGRSPYPVGVWSRQGGLPDSSQLWSGPMSAADVVVLAGSIVAIAALGWYFFAPRKGRTAEIAGGVQKITVTVRGGYRPDRIHVRQGLPVEITFDRQESGECTSR